MHSGGGGSSTPTEPTSIPENPTPTTPETPSTPLTPEPTTQEPIVELPTPPVAETIPQSETVIPKEEEIPKVVVLETKPKVVQKPKVITTPKTEPIPEITNTIETTTTNTENSLSSNEETLNQEYIPLINPILNQEETKTTNIISFLNKEAQRTFKETVKIVNQGKENIKEILETKEGNIVAKTVTVSGAIIGTGSLIASTAFATPLTFSELPLIPFRLWTLFLGLLGIKRNTRRWGVVYDSQTKQPLDPAVVSLRNTEGKEVASSITDIDGRYGFLVNPGTYTIFVNKSNYAFPTTLLANQTKDELYNDIYNGETITITDPSEVITKNIPLDRINFSWNEYEKERKELTTFSTTKLLYNRIFNSLFILGFILALVALLVAPEPYNGIIFALYVVLFIFKQNGISLDKKGSIFEKSTNLPLSYALIKLYYTDIGQEVAHAVTDKFGKFYCLVKNGTYTIVIEKKNQDGSYTPLYKQSNVTVKDGVLNIRFEV